MLEYEKQTPARLAYDRPSSKLIAFMAKHFGLKSYLPQNNNYVVFDEYFRASSSY
jgi:alpha-tubulin N-acetyltransferase 1